MVMESRFYHHETSLDSRVFYGASVTDADLVMTDGKSLEHVGVEPDILILPTAADLANQKDPAMAKAAGLVGGNLTSEEAGAAFPIENPNPN
jgi:C-terminal processing protease CtpA/Prc